MIIASIFVFFLFRRPSEKQHSDDIQYHCSMNEHTVVYCHLMTPFVWNSWNEMNAIVGSLKH